MNIHWAIVDYPKYYLPKAETAFENEEDSLNVNAVCPTCNTEFRYDPKSVVNPIKTVVCSLKCITDDLCPTPKREAVIIPETCSECGGSAKEQGFKHETDCSFAPVEKVGRVACSECGGPARGRGWNHKDGCSRNTQIKVVEIKPPCPECSGPARGRGWTHKNDCPVLMRRKESITLASTYIKTTRTCSECGGFARGRGFTHKDGCTKGKVTSIIENIV